MIIDFHAHIVPDAIAYKTLSKLSSVSGIEPSTDGTAAGLAASAKAAGATFSVNLPAITKASQFDSTNRFAAEVNGKDGIISFGGMHPDVESPEEKLDYIKSLGLPGIKLHPDYQDCFVDDPRNVRIIKYAVEIGLIVTLHAGLDAAFPDLTHCTPERCAHMLDMVYGTDEPERPLIVLAHMGGRRYYDDVNRLLSHRGVYYDLSYILGETDPAVVLQTVRNHGAERVLFGTDSPWSSLPDDIARMEKLGLTDREYELIMGMNAAELLGIHA